MTSKVLLLGSQYSTYRIGGALDHVIQPQTLEEAVTSLTALGADPLTVLGWGGNSIIASQGIRGTTLITRKMGWVQPVENTVFQLGAGVHLAKVAKVAQDASLTGAEFMIGIPGTIGGAVRMNAGALGQQMSDVVERVYVFNRLNTSVEVWEASELGFAYRKSAIQPEHHIVLAADCRFQPGNYAEITARMDGSVQFRKQHHPTEPNGGSVFQNPAPDQPVGKLLDTLGAKNPTDSYWRVGGVQISPLHANFIINVDSGTSLDVLMLMSRMKKAVYENYGYVLHPENLLLGDITEEERCLWKELTGE